MATKIPIWNTRMILLMEHALNTGAADTKTEFLNSVGFNPANFSRLKKDLSFTIDQLHTACKRYQVSMDWLTGLSSEMKIRKGKTALEQLREAVVAVSSELRRK